jgi:hypothetical protein
MLFARLGRKRKGPDAPRLPASRAGEQPAAARGAAQEDLWTHGADQPLPERTQSPSDLLRLVARLEAIEASSAGADKSADCRALLDKLRPFLAA